MRFKGYLNKVLVGESVAEFDYQPNKCGRAYRLVVVRKNISLQKGERVLFEEIKYHCRPVMRSSVMDYAFNDRDLGIVMK